MYNYLGFNDDTIDILWEHLTSCSTHYTSASVLPEGEALAVMDQRVREAMRMHGMTIGCLHTLSSRGVVVRCKVSVVLK